MKKWLLLALCFVPTSVHALGCYKVDGKEECFESLIPCYRDMESNVRVNGNAVGELCHKWYEVTDERNNLAYWYQVLEYDYKEQAKQIVRLRRALRASQLRRR